MLSKNKHRILNNKINLNLFFKWVGNLEFCCD